MLVCGGVKILYVQHRDDRCHVPGDIHAENVPVQPPLVTCDAPLYTAYRVLFFCFDLRPKVYKLEVHT